MDDKQKQRRRRRQTRQDGYLTCVIGLNASSELCSNPVKVRRVIKTIGAHLLAIVRAADDDVVLGGGAAGRMLLLLL